FLKGVGPARARALDRLGIATVGDLLAHYPRRWFDRTSTVPIGRLRPGQEATIQGEVLTSGERRTRRGGTLQTVSLGDDTGVVFCVWFNQRYVLKQFRPGARVVASGLVQAHGGQRQLAHPDYEVLEADDPDAPAGLHTGRLVPVYPLTSGVGQHWLRGLVHQALERLGPDLPESLPETLRRRRRLPARAEALGAVHFPGSQAELEAARRRLVYEELFTIQVLMALRRESRRALPGVALQKPGDLTRRLVEGLPFALTGAQRRVLADILADLRSGTAMHRLLQGDVGSGKTLVALIAALFVIEQGWQALLMAPTEVLARQHGKSLRRLAEPLGVVVETLTGSTPAAERRAILAAAGAGEVDLLVGTHALIQDDVAMPRLALSIVDEQHRFGVRQRSRGAEDRDGGRAVHVLVMSATPIPRSLSLTLYGDLDLSVIDELPPGRTPIATHLVKDADEDRVWDDLRAEVAAGRQAYVIHPVIEETEGQDLKAAVAEHARLAAEVFPDRRVGLLHGKLKAREKDAVMDDFAAGRLDVLVATTVVEVGVDVPNASRLVIHNPERFGLAQLHQLRGRVGRGSAASTCWLVVDRFLGDEAWQRLAFFAGHADGFALAEEDLRRRGPGDAWGVRQHGAPGFRLANPLRDNEMVQVCRDDARGLLAEDPRLEGPDGRLVRRALEEGFARALPLQAG
ncbi:MAG TPA: ATP-dependent DNA helicase RecG, partial [Candidatus Krumholzibacteria bacterium]|nr:ATP-dependent DNA helicase RecG [Candidatus Krumholzibacteria bacterium]